MHKHIKPLDGLRALAIFFVVFSHSMPDRYRWDAALGHAQFSPSNIVVNGWMGVDLFFVLSGFLIGAKLITSDINLPFLKTFAIKRFFRIAPAFYCSIILILLGLKLLPTLDDGNTLEVLQKYAAPLVSHFLFVNDYFAEKPVIDYIFWSIPIEMKFYLLLPFIILCMNRVSNYDKKLLILIAGYILYFCGKSTAIYIQYGGLVPIEAFLFDIRRPFHFALDGLWIGVICAYFYQTRHYKNLGDKTCQIMMISSLILFSVLLFYHYEKVINDAVFVSFFNAALRIPLFSLAAGMILIASVKGCSATNFLSHPFLTFIAKISYSLYLIHVFGKILSTQIIDTLESVTGSFVLSWGISLPFYFLFAVIFAYLLNTYVEDPGIKYSKRLTSDKKQDHKDKT